MVGRRSDDRRVGFGPVDGNAIGNARYQFASDLSRVGPEQLYFYSLTAGSPKIGPVEFLCEIRKQGRAVHHVAIGPVVYRNGFRRGGRGDGDQPNDPGHNNKGQKGPAKEPLKSAYRSLRQYFWGKPSEGPRDYGLAAPIWALGKAHLSVYSSDSDLLPARPIQCHN